MKKIVAILLVLTVMLTLAACEKAEPKTALAYEIYNEATGAMSDIGSLAANTSVTMSMVVEGEEMVVEMSGLVKAVYISETEVEMQMDMATTIMGEDMEIKYFYKDGIYYMDAAGQKIAMEMPLEQMLEQANTEALAFPDTAVKNQQVTEKNGGQELSFTLDGEALIDAVAGQLGSLSSMLGGETNFSMGDIEYVVFVDGQDTLKNTWMSFSMELSVMEDTIPISAEVSMDYLQINNVSIDFPTDLDSYELIDMGTLL